MLHHAALPKSHPTVIKSSWHYNQNFGLKWDLMSLLQAQAIIAVNVRGKKWSELLRRDREGLSDKFIWDKDYELDLWPVWLDLAKLRYFGQL